MYDNSPAKRLLRNTCAQLINKLMDDSETCLFFAALLEQVVGRDEHYNLKISLDLNTSSGILTMQLDGLGTGRYLTMRQRKSLDSRQAVCADSSLLAMIENL